MDLRFLGMILVVAASAIEAVGQVAFKRAASAAAGGGALTGLRALNRAPGWIGFGLACFIAEGLLFTVALRLLDVSIAFPAGSLTFVGVVILSRVWLRETVGVRRWVGVALIVAGTALLGVS